MAELLFCQKARMITRTVSDKFQEEVVRRRIMDQSSAAYH